MFNPEMGLGNPGSLQHSLLWKALWVGGFFEGACLPLSIPGHVPSSTWPHTQPLPRAQQVLSMALKCSTQDEHHSPLPTMQGNKGSLPMSMGWSEEVRGGGCCFRLTISTISGDERRSNSFIMITWLKWDSFTTKFRQCSWDRQARAGKWGQPKAPSWARGLLQGAELGPSLSMHAPPHPAEP